MKKNLFWLVSTTVMLALLLGGIGIDAYGLVGRTTTSGYTITMEDVARNFLRHTLSPAFVSMVVGFLLGRCE